MPSWLDKIECILINTSPGTILPIVVMLHSVDNSNLAIGGELDLQFTALLCPAVERFLAMHIKSTDSTNVHVPAERSASFLVVGSTPGVSILPGQTLSVVLAKLVSMVLVVPFAAILFPADIAARFCGEVQDKTKTQIDQLTSPGASKRNNPNRNLPEATSRRGSAHILDWAVIWLVCQRPLV